MQFGINVRAMRVDVCTAGVVQLGYSFVVVLTGKSSVEKVDCVKLDLVVPGRLFSVCSIVRRFRTVGREDLELRRVLRHKGCQ